MYINLYIYIYY